MIADLGTLGGPNSVAYSINDLGKIVGVAQDADMYWHAVTWTKGSLWFKSTKTDLGVVATRVSTPPTFIYHGMGRLSFISTSILPAPSPAASRPRSPKTRPGPGMHSS